jgi:hypothetical protein
MAFPLYALLYIYFDLQAIAKQKCRNKHKHSKKLITSNIDFFFDYCQRFYDRQCITRENVNTGILSKFEELLNNYFSSEKP